MEDEEDQPTYDLFKLSQGKVTPIVVNVQLDKVTVPMEVDTGAARTVISDATVQKVSNGRGPPPATAYHDSAEDIHRREPACAGRNQRSSAV